MGAPTVTDGSPGNVVTFLLRSFKVCLYLGTVVPDTKARRRLGQWMDQDPEGRTQTAIAIAMGIKQPSVSGWLLRETRPEPHRRPMLEDLTDGFVAAADWMTPNERALSKSVKPMRRSGTEG
jgi:hypothetical protein